MLNPEIILLKKLKQVNHSHFVGYFIDSLHKKERKMTTMHKMASQTRKKIMISYPAADEIVCIQSENVAEVTRSERRQYTT
jgi:hypothetical protein